MQELVLLPRGGLCNRLRSIAAANRLGVELGIKVTVVWEWGGPDGWRLLFQPDDRLNVVGGLSETESQLPRLRTCLASKGGTETNQKLKFPDQPKCVLESGHNFSVASLPPAEFAKMGCFYVRPSETIEAMVQGYVKANFKRPTVGVHIRRTDNKESLLRSPDVLFREAFRELVASGSQIFLGTDNPETRRQYLAEFGEAIIELTKEGEETARWPREQTTLMDVADDWMDLLLLSRCDYVLGSGYSSYSGTAIMLNGDPRSRVLTQH